MTKTFLSEICFISDDVNSDSEARDLLYEILESATSTRYSGRSITSASVEDIYEIE